MALAFGILGGSALIAGGNIAGAAIQSNAQQQALAQAQQQEQQLSQQAISGDFLGQFGGSDIFGTVPQAALYQPVAPIDFTQNQLDTIASNLGAFPMASTLAGATNTFNLGQALDRINTLVPDYQSSLNQEGSVTNALLMGKLPYSDVLSTTSNSSSLAGALGTPGGSQNATLKDLGLSQLSAEQTGANMFNQMLSGAQQVMPTSSLMSPSSMFYDPTTMANLQLQQNAQNIEQAQLEQASAQNAFNLAAAPNPTAASLFNLQAGLIPATLQTGNSAAYGAGISNASSALGSGLSTYALLNALQQRGAGLSTGLYGGAGGSFAGTSGAVDTSTMTADQFSAAF